MPLFLWNMPIGRLSRGARLSIALVLLLCMGNLLYFTSPSAGIRLLPLYLIVAFLVLCAVACIRGRVGSIAGRLAAAMFVVAIVALVVNETHVAWSAKGASALASAAVWGPFLAFLAWGVPCVFFALRGHFPGLGDRVSVEKQMETLRACGISLSEGVRLGDLLRMSDPELMEAVPYFDTLIALGGNTKDKRKLPLCPNLWLCKMVSIVDAGSYAAIVDRLALMGGNPLDITNIRSDLNSDAGSATVDFDLAGKYFHWDLAVDGDVVDPEVFIQFDGLLAEKSDLRLYTSAALESGEFRLLGCFTSDEYANLIEVSQILVPVAELGQDDWRADPSDYEDDEELEETSH